MQTSGESMDHIILVGLISGLAFAFFAWRCERLILRLFLALLALGLLVPTGILFAGRNPALVDARFRTFQFFYWSLGMGTRREEVLTTLAKWYPPEKAIKPPRIATDTAALMEFVMTPDSSGLPANERIILKMEAGQVVGKEYDADR